MIFHRSYFSHSAISSTHSIFSSCSRSSPLFGIQHNTRVKLKKTTKKEHKHPKQMASTKTIDVELGNVKSFFTDVQEVSFDSSAAKSAINQLQSRHVDPGAILTTATTGEWLIEANALEQLSCCHFSLFLFVSSLQFTSFPNKSKTGVTNLLQIIFLLFTTTNNKQRTNNKQQQQQQRLNH